MSGNECNELKERMNKIENGKLDNNAQIFFIHKVLGGIIDEMGNFENMDDFDVDMFDQIGILYDSKVIPENIFKLMNETRSIRNMLVNDGMDEEALETATANIIEISNWFFQRYAIYSESENEELLKKMEEIIESPETLEIFVDEVLAAEGYDNDGNLMVKMNTLKDNSIVSNDIFKSMYVIKEIENEIIQKKETPERISQLKEEVQKLNKWYSKNYGF